MTGDKVSDDVRTAIAERVALLLKTAPTPTPEQIDVLRRWFGPTADRGHRTRRAA